MRPRSFAGVGVCFTHGNDQISDSKVENARTAFQNNRFKVYT
mgnify:FL=1